MITKSEPVINLIALSMGHNCKFHGAKVLMSVYEASDGTIARVGPLMMTQQEADAMVALNPKYRIAIDFGNSKEVDATLGWFKERGFSGDTLRQLVVDRIKEMSEEVKLMDAVQKGLQK